ncbi:MAG TPA: nitroreductase family protein [Gaiellaceae bacterium]|nr:nitroreductase family protein [Gaiellaceae bacterium]
MDTFLAIASRRDWKRYADRPIAEDVVQRILDAGRLAGSGGNRQPWRFFVIESRALRDEIAETVFAPQNVLGARLVVAVGVRGKGPTAFDGGRAVQNMLLAAWNEGIAATPNGVADPERIRSLLALAEDERPLIVLTFGHPRRPLDPESRSAEEWSAEANRKPLAEVVERR